MCNDASQVSRWMSFAVSGTITSGRHDLAVSSGARRIAVSFWPDDTLQSCDPGNAGLDPFDAVLGMVAEQMRSPPSNRPDIQHAIRAIQGCSRIHGPAGVQFLCVGGDRRNIDLKCRGNRHLFTNRHSSHSSVLTIARFPAIQRRIRMNLNRFPWSELFCSCCCPLSTHGG